MRLRLPRIRWTPTAALWLAAVLACLGGADARGQQRTEFKLGGFVFTVAPSVTLAYDSNVDGAYPEDEDPVLEKADFYWQPNIALNAAPVRLNPATTMTLGGAFGYLDYFKRDDLDTETYNGNVAFSSASQYITLTGSATVDYSIEGNQDEYRPGGVSRDPTRTDTLVGGVEWHWQKWRANWNGTFTRERHDEEEYKSGNNDEYDWIAGIYLDFLSWASLFYTYEWDKTINLVPEEVETIEKTDSFGLTLTYSGHPQITYTLALERTKHEPKAEEKGWEPTHTISVADSFDLTKHTHFSASATWDDTVEDDEVSFTYTLALAQELTERISHNVSFTQEPESTFGSNSDTETTTLAYTLSVSDFLLKGVGASGGITHEKSTPLGDSDAQSEYTTTMNFSLSHSRVLSRRLSRTLSYTYTWENSNFHTEGANEKHLVMYVLNYLL